MKIVVVDWDIAYPPDSGKRLRTLNLLLELAERHDITYFSRGDGDSDQGREAASFFRSRGVHTVFANVPLPAKKGWRYWLRHAANVASTTPFAVASHASVRFRQRLQEYAARNKVDVWQLEWSPYVDMLRGVRGAKTLLMAHNVDTLIWQRYAETETRPWARWYLAEQQRRMEKFERRIFHQSTHVVAVSDADAQLMRSQFGVTNVDVVDNGVDLTYFTPSAEPRNPLELLFVGSLDWRPNVDGVDWMMREVLPRILADEPKARLTVVGRNPSASFAARIRGNSACELQANAPDVRPFLARAGMMVVPLRIGGGSRLKILEGAASGIPVVSTTVGAEGLKFCTGRDLAIGDTAEAMAAEIVRWIRDPREALACAEQARRIAIESYGWSRLAEELEMVWEKVADRTTASMMIVQ